MAAKSLNLKKTKNKKDIQITEDTVSNSAVIKNKIKETKLSKNNNSILGNSFDVKPKAKWKKESNKQSTKDGLHLESPHDHIAESKLGKAREIKLPNISSKKRKKYQRKKRRRRILIFILGFFIFTGLLGYLFVISPLLRMRNSADIIMDVSRELFSDIENKDIRNLDTQIETIRTEIQNVESELDNFRIFEIIPFTSGYYRNLQYIQNAVNKTDRMIQNNLEEFKEVLKVTGFTVDNKVPVEVLDPITGEVIEGGAESATSMILSKLPDFIDFYERMEPEIIDILEELNKMDTQYIPSLPGLDVQGKYVEFKQFVKKYPEISSKTLDFMRNLPELIGAEDPTDYLIILQNESEMRASGGLLTAYGNMSLDKGEFVGDISFSDMWNLENYVSYDLATDTGNRNIYGQLYLMNMGCGSSYLRAQDSGIYPDLFWTAEKFREYYDLANTYNKIRFPDYEHIITVNNHFAENLLSIIQPLEVEGFGEVTADTLFEFIKAETDSPELAYSAERKAIIQDIANAAKEKFSDLSLSQIPDITRIFVESVNGKDIAFYSTDEQMQDFFEEYYMSGRIIKDFNGDYFHFNEAQNCSLKLNKFVRDEIIQDIYIDEEGDISKEVHVYWEQPQVYDKSLKLQYDPTGNFTYRAWTRIFAPEDSYNFESDGLKRSTFLYYNPQQYYDEEMEKEVSDNVIRFDHRRMEEDDPIPTQELNVSYNLPDYLNYNKNDGYELLIQKHPGKSWGEPYTINIHHNGQVNTLIFTLDRDKVIKYKNGIISIENYTKSLDWLVDLSESLPFNIL